MCWTCSLCFFRIQEYRSFTFCWKPRVFVVTQLVIKRLDDPCIKWRDLSVTLKLFWAVYNIGWLVAFLTAYFLLRNASVYSMSEQRPPQGCEVTKLHTCRPLLLGGSGVSNPCHLHMFVVKLKKKTSMGTKTGPTCWCTNELRVALHSSSKNAGLLFIACCFF